MPLAKSPKPFTKPMKAQIGRFKEKALDILMSIGAEETEHSNRFILVTYAGDLDVQINQDWLCCQFRDVESARDIVGGERLNAQTGRWDWKGPRALDSFQMAIEKYMDLPGKRVCRVPQGNTLSPHPF
ncbi:hypothetical protein ACI2KR_06835 [Pseudomonas luteola]